MLKGSHHLGRIEHKRVGGQTGADTDRVDMVKKVCTVNLACIYMYVCMYLQVIIYMLCQVLSLVHVELEPGDALFFHCNLLHCSNQNNSDRRRWAFLIAFNRATNNPMIKHHHPMYTPLTKVSAPLNLVS